MNQIPYFQPESKKESEEAILSGKFLSYVPDDGWGYRTIEEVSRDSQDHA